MYALPSVAPALRTARRCARLRVSTLLLAALLTAGPAQALSLELLLRMPLERLLQLQFSSQTGAQESPSHPPGDRHAR